MTDREILELLLTEVTSIKKAVDDLTSKVFTDDYIFNTKFQILQATAKVNGMNSLILEEVERIHETLAKHNAKTTMPTV